MCWRVRSYMVNMLPLFSAPWILLNMRKSRWRLKPHCLSNFSRKNNRERYISFEISLFAGSVVWSLCDAVCIYYNIWLWSGCLVHLDSEINVDLICRDSMLLHLPTCISCILFSFSIELDCHNVHTAVGLNYVLPSSPPRKFFSLRPLLSIATSQMVSC